MMPIVDTNWSLQNQQPLIECHVLRAVAVQGAMGVEAADKEFAKLHEHATTPGLGGLPNSIVGFVDIDSDEALQRIEYLSGVDRVTGVHVVLQSKELNDSALKCMDWLAAKSLTVDISGSVSGVVSFVEHAVKVPELRLVCDLSQCMQASAPLAMDEWVDLASRLRSQRDLAVKITHASGVVDALASVIKQLLSHTGSQGLLFGSGSCGRSFWQEFDQATQWATAQQRDQLFRQNGVKFYGL